MNNPTIVASATVTNVIPNGAGFAIKHGTGETCYIPAGVVKSASICAGQVIEAQMVINPMEDNRGRTPYLVTYVPSREPFQMELPLYAPDQAAPVADNGFNRAEVCAHVRTVMQEGGVWSTLTMFQDYMGDDEAKRDDDLLVYNAVSATLRKMFDEDACAKWSMWTRKSQARPGREWFSCHPKNVEVAEWEDE